MRRPTLKFRSKRATSLRFQSALRRMNERREAELSSPNYSLLQHESNRVFPHASGAVTDDVGSSGYGEVRPIDLDVEEE